MYFKICSFFLLDFYIVCVFLFLLVEMGRNFEFRCVLAFLFSTQNQVDQIKIVPATRKTFFEKLPTKMLVSLLFLKMLKV